MACYKSKINGHSISYSFYISCKHQLNNNVNIANFQYLYYLSDFFILNAMYMSVLPAYMNEQYMYAGPLEARRGLQIHWNWN